NGYFTVLKSNGWFSAVPLPGGFRYLKGQSKTPQAPENPAGTPATASAFASTLPPAQIHAAAQATTIRLQTIDSGTPDHRFMRPALIVLAATALTWILLWCTSHP
ncbi:MAG: hypothetical protein ABR928_23140, partial [Terracidiphilus sp.]